MTNERPLRVLVLVHRQQDASPYCFFVHDQVKALRALGHDVQVISPVGTLPFYDRLRPEAAAIVKNTPRRAVVEGVPVYYPRFPALGDAGERLLGGGPEARAAMRIARRLHRDKPFDILHAHMLDRDGHAGLFIARRLGVPMALTVHGTDVFRYFGGGRVPSPRNAETARCVDGLMAVSGKLLSLVEPYRGGGLSEVIPNGVDLSLVSPEPSNTPRRVLSVGTLKARKCMGATLEAFIALSGDYPDARLTIVGIGEEREMLQRRIDASGLGGRAVLAGGVSHAEVMRLMAESDAFVLPSYDEGQGIVYIEAMASGCVAVGSVGEGIAETIRDGENGFLVPSGDAAAVERTLRRIFDAPDDLRDLRARAREDALALSWAENARRTSAFYRRVLAGR